jgi:tryptophan synthase alpha subunit
LKRLRPLSRVPVAAGFGIRTPDQVHALRGHADAVIIGSALIECIERGDDPAALLSALASA